MEGKLLCQRKLQSPSGISSSILRRAKSPNRQMVPLQSRWGKASLSWPPSAPPKPKKVRIFSPLPLITAKKQPLLENSRAAALNARDVQRKKRFSPHGSLTGPSAHYFRNVG